MTLYLLTALVVVLAGIGGYFILRRRPHALFVLAYEKAGISPKTSRFKTSWISAQRFEKQVQFLRRHGFTPVPLGTLQPGAKRPSKPVLLAFLGGYQNFYSEIFPVLEKYKIPAALFMPPSLAGSYNAWQNPHEEPWQNLLTETELKNLKKSGLISFGALAPLGQDVTQLPGEQAAAQLQEGLFRTERQLGLKAEGFAFYPAQNWDEQKAARLLPDGFSLPLITLQNGINPRTGKSLFFRTLQPGMHPLLTRYILWKHR